jgi:3-deoxy-manno-octulosonate cytidylyltransferase (CMP-KDO synthetase)
MICWTVNRSSQAKGLREVFVAAEDLEVVQTVTRFGGKAKLVQGEFVSGSDRIAAAIADIDASIIVNIQGDEPFIDADFIDQALDLLESRPDFDVTTAVRPISNMEEYLAPNSVKAVMDHRGRCLYFSRSPIPAIQKPAAPLQIPSGVPFYHHIGLYCFRREALLRFAKSPKLPLETCEGLEQLRILEIGGSIGAIVVPQMGLSVNSPEDLIVAQEYALKKGLKYQE